MKKLLDYLVDNAWTWAGTGMVLITLSGPTFKQAVFLTGVAIMVHSIITFTKKDDNE
jgi:hypothetical protein